MAECPPAGPEVCSWVATEIMGWHKSESGRFWKYDDDTYTGFNTGQGEHTTTFRPDEDRNHTALMEDRLEKMGLGREYMKWLYRLVIQVPMEWEFKPGLMISFDSTLRLAMASAYDRVRAAWEVMTDRADPQKGT